MNHTGEGVCVQASTLGSLEALLEFLRSPAVKIPVSGINIGPVNRRDIMRASVMLEKGRKKYACVLAFDVPVSKEARELAEDAGVKVFTADIIYHLFDQFTAYLRQVRHRQQRPPYPCSLHQDSSPRPWSSTTPSVNVLLVVRTTGRHPLQLICWHFQGCLLAGLWTCCWLLQLLMQQVHLQHYW